MICVEHFSEGLGCRWSWEGTILGLGSCEVAWVSGGWAGKGRTLELRISPVSHSLSLFLKCFFLLLKFSITELRMNRLGGGLGGRGWEVESPRSLFSLCVIFSCHLPFLGLSFPRVTSGGWTLWCQRS